MYRVPRGTVERDYVLTNLLSMISRFRHLDKMVFKGGTSLKKVHFKDFRFSEDLDFVFLEDVSEDFINHVRENMNDSDVKFTDVIQLPSRSDSTRLKIKYDQFDGFSTSIKVDLSMRGDVVLKHESKPVLHSYESLPDTFSVPVMALEEIMAEKVRAMTYSDHPRHLHDTWYLHNHGIRINPDLVRTKVKSAYGENFDVGKLEGRMSAKEKDWIADLRPLLSDAPPPFDDTFKEVLSVVRIAME